MGVLLHIFGVPGASLAMVGAAFLLGFGAVVFVAPGTATQALNRFRRPLKGAQQIQRETPEEIVRSGVADLFDELPVALLRIGPDGTVLQSNAAARTLLRLQADERPKFESLIDGLGRSVSAWLHVATENPDVLKPEIIQARRRRGEAVLQVTLMHSPLAGDQSLIAVLSDATKLKTLEAQFVQSQKMQAIGQLAGGVAHDFNNLLTAISGYCDLLLLRHDKNDPDYSDLQQIAQNANRAASLVAHLLAFSRKQTLSPVAVSVNDVVSDMSHLLSRLLGEKVTLSAEYGKNLPRAFVDPRQLEQVIMNLVLNARDAMDEGGEVRLHTDSISYTKNTRIQAAQVPKGCYVTVRVEDTGTGIPPEDLDKIFEPFFSTKEEGKGTGLGLSMVYGIVKQTGGFIFCDSTRGVGTRFDILLPAYDGKSVVEQPVRQRKGPTTELGGVVVLLVEDEAPVRSFAARALKMHGVRVIEAESAEAALDIMDAPDRRIDIVVSDVVMPGMDGPTWVRKSLSQGNDFKVIFVSGYAEESFSEEYPEIPNAEFLPKPFTLRELVEKVRELAE